MAESGTGIVREPPLMVAIQRSISRPKFSCILADREKKLSTLYKEFSADLENNNEILHPIQTIQVSTSENGDSIPFQARVTIDQATKMLRSDILWVNYQIASEKPAPPSSTKNAFDVLKLAQSSKKSLPVKYSNPVNGSFKLFNHLVSLCQETGVFFR